MEVKCNFSVKGTWCKQPAPNHHSSGNIPLGLHETASCAVLLSDGHFICRGTTKLRQSSSVAAASLRSARGGSVRARRLPRPVRVGRVSESTRRRRRGANDPARTDTDQRRSIMRLITGMAALPHEKTATATTDARGGRFCASPRTPSSSDAPQLMIDSGGRIWARLPPPRSRCPLLAPSPWPRRRPTGRLWPALDAARRGGPAAGTAGRPGSDSGPLPARRGSDWRPDRV